MSRITLPYPHAGQIGVRNTMRRFNWLSAGRRWRKTTLAMAIAVESAAKGKSIIWGAPTFDQVRIGFTETKRAANDVADFNMSRMEVSFPSGGIIHYRSLDNPDNARGYTADGVVMDECGFINKDAWVEVLRPMLIDTGGWNIGIGTPYGRNWFWEEHQKAIDNQDTMAWIVPTLGVQIQNGGLIRSPHPLENPDIRFDEIEQLFKTMPELKFRQEILGEFVDFQGGVFRRVQEAIRCDNLLQPEDKHQYIAGVDVAASVDYTVVSVMDVQSKNLVYKDRFNRVDYNVLEDRLENVYKLFKLDTMKIEANSIGQGVIDHLRNRRMNIIPFTTTSATKQTIITALQSAFEHGDIGIYNDPVLIGELLSFESKRNTSGSFSYSAPDGMHDDCVMSLALAWDCIGKSSVILFGA